MIAPPTGDALLLWGLATIISTDGMRDRLDERSRQRIE